MITINKINPNKTQSYIAPTTHTARDIGTTNKDKSAIHTCTRNSGCIPNRNETMENILLPLQTPTKTNT